MWRSVVGVASTRELVFVTFVARYQLQNMTQYRLAYLQRHQLHNEVRRGNEQTHTCTHRRVRESA